MIKFKELFHKETKTIIPYEDWKKHIEEDKVMVFAVTEQSSWRYIPKNMLISDEFEIVYDREALNGVYKENENDSDKWVVEINGCEENEQSLGMIIDGIEMYSDIKIENGDRIKIFIEKNIV